MMRIPPEHVRVGMRVALRSAKRIVSYEITGIDLDEQVLYFRATRGIGQVYYGDSPTIPVFARPRSASDRRVMTLA